MRIFLLATLLIAGCVRPGLPPSVKVDSEKPLSPQVISGVTNALEHSQTFLDLRRHAAKVMVVVESEKDGWVMVDIGNLSEDFFHRWATLKVQTNSGAILKLGTDEKLEDKWLVEFQPAK